MIFESSKRSGLPWRRKKKPNVKKKVCLVSSVSNRFDDFGSKSVDRNLKFIENVFKSDRKAPELVVFGDRGETTLFHAIKPMGFRLKIQNKRKHVSSGRQHGAFMLCVY